MSFNSPIATFGGVSQVTATRGFSDPELGTRVSIGGNEYLYVYNTSASSAPVGRAVCMSGVTGYSVTVSTTAYADHIVGVVHHTAIPAANYGWVLTRGIGTIITSTSVALVTGTVATVQGDGYWDNLIVSALTSQVQPSARAKLLTTATSASTGTAYISCY